MNRILLPLGTFGVTVLLAALVGSGRPVEALLRPPAEATGKCRCQLKVKDISIDFEYALTKIDEKGEPPLWFNAFLDGTLKATICQEKSSGSAEGKVTTTPMIELLTKVTFWLPKKPFDPQVVIKKLSVPLTPKEDALTCAGKDYAYEWDFNINSLGTDAFILLQELYAKELAAGKYTDVTAGEFYRSNGKGLKYEVHTEATCDGKAMKDKCSDEAALINKPSVVTDQGKSALQCVKIPCSFGTP